MTFPIPPISAISVKATAPLGLSRHLRARLAWSLRLSVILAVAEAFTSPRVGLSATANAESHSPIDAQAHTRSNDAPENAIEISDSTTPQNPLQWEHGPWTVKFELFAGTQLVGQNNSFWGLSDVFAPSANYSEDRVWDELWAVPGVRVNYQAMETIDLYGGLAVAFTGNLGRDLFEQGNSGRVSLEQLFAGFKIGSPDSDVSIDISGGQQPYRMGTGMLIDLGAQNGNQRGAVLVSPRRSWEYTAVVKMTIGRFAADAFVLDYNEIGSADPDTTLAGGKIEYRLSPLPGDEFAGVSYIHAFDSTMPYIRAPLTIIENGRDGTQTINPYVRLRPLGDSAPGLYAAVEGAYQWNDRIDLSAFALSFEISHQWQNAALRPKISYAFRHFSGDNPRTSDLERFDPLFYDGGVHAYASGSNAALTFYNTNVQSHRVSLNLTLSVADFVTLSYWRVQAAEENSPLQFGQGGRLQTIDGQPVLISGVPDKHLSDDLYIEYVRMLTPNAFLTLGFGVSFPGDGLERAAGKSLDPWLGALVNLTFKF